MNKIFCLLIVVCAFLVNPLLLSAQSGEKVAVAPVSLSADGASLAQLNNMSKSLTGIISQSFATQGMTPLQMSENVLATGLDAAKAQAKNMGADYIFVVNTTQRGTQFVLTGQLIALGKGRSSGRVTSTSEGSTNLPLAGEQLVFMATDHLLGGGSKVASVSVRGNTMVDSQAILNSLRIRPGGTYNEAKATSDISRIYSLGYFEDVQVKTAQGRGGLAVTFIVKERSQLGGIVFKGNEKFDHDDLMKVVGIKEYDIPSEDLLVRSVDNIKKLYTDKGFPNVQISTSFEPGDEGRSLLVYHINEGGKIYIKKVQFDGNEFYSDWKLSGKIDTNKRNFLISWLSGSGKLNHEKLSSDVQKLEAFYHNTGFLDARVGEPSIDESEGGGLIVTFPIFEGTRYKVGSVTVGGDILEGENEKKLLKKVELRKEKWFNREMLQNDLKRLQIYYADKGYAYSTVEPILSPAGDDAINVELVVTPNQQVYFDRITIVGNEKTRDKVIRRQLSIAEGDLFSASKIQGSQSNLMRSSYFDQVNISPGPSDTDDKMNARVEVKERPTGSFQIGGGYSNYNSLFGVARITQDNLFGYGRRISLEANVGSKSNYFDLSFTDPWVADIPLTVGFDIFKYFNRYDTYKKESTGGAIRAGYPVWGNFYLSARYSYENIDIKDVSASSSKYLQDMRNYSIDSVFTVSLRRDTRNHFFFPTSGTTSRLTYSVASGFLGGDTDFSTYEAEGAFWIPAPVIKGASFMVHGQIGYMKEGKEGGLPVYEKYMIGGINSVRGYDWYDISPRDKNTREAIGGEKMMVFNTELAIPLFREEGLYGVVFYDMGNVWSKDGKYSFSDMKKSWGGGLRYLSPMGPLRIEYGKTINPDQYQSSGRWEFTMGSMF